jgi:hypothetical protein
VPGTEVPGMMLKCWGAVGGTDVALAPVQVTTPVI